MKVLSLFDGISCARVALERAGILVEMYWACEIDKYAIHVSQKNYPDICQLGSVTDCLDMDFKEVDLLIGGSPCQDLSIAKKDRKGLKGERSGLFWEYVRILNEVKPKYFILENVNSMPKEAKDTISEALGVQPVMINASLVSAQNRKRLFWVGERVDWYKEKDSSYSHSTYKQVEIPQPEDRGILIKDILEKNVDEKYFLSEKLGKTIKEWGETQKLKGNSFKANIFDENSEDKTSTLKATYHKIQGDGTYVMQFGVVQNMQIRKLTPIECERLQGLPDNYTEGISNTQRYKCLGNAFNVDVVAHILKYLK